MLAHECVEPLDAVLDRRVRCRVREADVLSVAGHAAAEVDVGEHGDARLVQQALAKLLRICRADAPARLGHVRPCVERAARVWHFTPGTSFSRPHDQVAPLEEARVHRLGAESCGPLIASTAAHCVICDAHDRCW